MAKANLLYVEDDESLSYVTKDHLELSGFQVIHCANGHQAKKAIETGVEQYDLVLLDVMLPGHDGFELASLIRKQDADLPILFLTARGMKEDRIHGLQIGADDYITKPFSIEELVLKIAIFLRRSRVQPAASLPSERKHEIGSFQFDPANLSLLHQGSQMEKRLTQREADLLLFLCENSNRIVERSLILQKIWGKDDYFMGRSLDVFISRLRKYLQADPQIEIENVHGIGFCLKVK